MRFGWKCVAVLLCFGVAGFSSPASAQTTFEEFIGRNSFCTGTDAFRKYITSLRDRYSPGGNKSASLAIPDALKDQFGEPRAKNKDGYTQVFVPIAGAKFYELSVVELVFSLGIENGIYGNGIVFSEPLKAARGQIGDFARKANKRVRHEMEGVCGPNCDHVWLRSHKKGSELSCDMST